MNATEVIKRDHEATKELFAQFDAATKEGRKELETPIFDALAAHEAMEDNHFYPALADKDVDDELYGPLKMEQVELRAEVLAVRALPGDRSKRIEKMMKSVLEHAEKEEKEILPEAERLFTADELEALGERMEPDSAVAQSKK